MVGLTFEQLRIPIALVLVLIAAFVLVPRGDESPTAVSATPTPAITVGEPGGAILETPPPTPSPIPTVTPEPTQPPTPEPVADAFAARVAACVEISGSTCRGEFSSMPPRMRRFTALVTFSDAHAGDTISVTLSGPVTIAGGPYTLGGGGNGYYYSTFQVPRLPPGQYTLTATRNGTPVATTTFVRGG